MVLPEIWNVRLVAFRRFKFHPVGALSKQYDYEKT
jgi:hypothetical protein